MISADIRVNGEFYLDLIPNLLVKNGKKGAILDVNPFVCFGTPDDVRTYEYWEEYFRKETERGRSPAVEA